jgi:hypothetical protein
MPEFNRETLVQLWTDAKAGRTPADPDLARAQKYMMMHDDMHEHFEAAERDPAAPLTVDGESLLVHVLMDAATEKALELDEPAGVRTLMQSLLTAGMDPGRAFHVLSQAMQHEMTVQLTAGRDELDPAAWLRRCIEYAQQAMAAR